MALLGWAIGVAVGAFVLTLIMYAARSGGMGRLLSPAALFGRDTRDSSPQPHPSSLGSKGVEPRPADSLLSTHITVFMTSKWSGGTLGAHGEPSENSVAGRELLAHARSPSTITLKLLKWGEGSGAGGPAHSQPQAALAYALKSEQPAAPTPAEYALCTSDEAEWVSEWDVKLLKTLQDAAARGNTPITKSLLTALPPGHCVAEDPPRWHAAPSIICSVERGDANTYTAPALSLDCVFGLRDTLRGAPFVETVATAEAALFNYVLHARLAARGVRLFAPLLPLVTISMARPPSTPKTRAGNATLLGALRRFEVSSAAGAATLREFEALAHAPRSELEDQEDAQPPW